MTDQQLTIIFVLSAVVVMICLAFMWHADRDAELGRELREAAGSESEARVAIEGANLARCLREKHDRHIDAQIRRGMRKQHLLPENVVRLVPRYHDGRVVPFRPDGDAA